MIHALAENTLKLAQSGKRKHVLLQAFHRKAFHLGKTH